MKKKDPAGKKNPANIALEVEFAISSARADQCPESHLPEFAFIGRSNVGKSSLINMLCGRKEMARTSSKPGKTRLINHFLVQKTWYIVDLPGYGYAAVSKKERGSWSKMVEKYLLQRENLTNLFVLIDVRIPPQQADLDFIAFLGGAGVPFSIVFTKADKVKKNALQGSMAAFRKEMLKTWEAMPPVFITSSSTGLGRKELLDYVRDIMASLKQ